MGVQTISPERRGWLISWARKQWLDDTRIPALEVRARFRDVAALLEEAALPREPDIIDKRYAELRALMSEYGFSMQNRTGPAAREDMDKVKDIIAVLDERPRLIDERDTLKTQGDDILSAIFVDANSTMWFVQASFAVDDAVFRVATL